MQEETEIKTLEEILKEFRKAVSEVFPDWEITEGKIGRFRPDAVIKVDDKIVGTVLVLKEKEGAFSVVKRHLPSLLKREIPLLFCLYTDEKGNVTKLEVFHLFSFEKKELSPGSSGLNTKAMAEFIKREVRL